MTPDNPCLHCGHDWCYHQISRGTIAAYQALGLEMNAMCRGLFVRRRGIKRQPCDDGQGCACPGFEPANAIAAKGEYRP